jgi:hypothetical protein
VDLGRDGQDLENFSHIMEAKDLLTRQGIGSNE